MGDVEEDGDWEAPQIPNPEYKGEWKQKQIDNPAYKGEWVYPMVANPAYKEDDTVYHRCNPCTAIGFELWQVKAGTLFDDIILTDSVEEAKKFAADTFAVKSKAEQAMQKKIDEAAAAKAAEESKKKEAEEEGWEEEEEEEEGKEEAAMKNWQPFKRVFLALVVGCTCGQSCFYVVPYDLTSLVIYLLFVFKKRNRFGEKSIIKHCFCVLKK